MTKSQIKDLLKKDNPIIFEIGCNDGEDTEQFLKEFKNIKLHCFEPDPRAIKQFKQRINDKRCSLHEVAISNNDGKADFNLSNSDPTKLWTPKEIGANWNKSSSLKKPYMHLHFHRWCFFDKTIKVKTTKLDTFIKKNNINNIDFIWADVQGAEKDLIEGAKKALTITQYFYTEF